MQTVPYPDFDAQPDAADEMPGVSLNRPTPAQVAWRGESIETIVCDVLVLGSGGAGLMAAMHAHDAGRGLRVVLAAKGLVGKSGCTRMVHGLNAVLHPRDSLEMHFRDTLENGAFLNDQELAWKLVSGAPETVRELELRHGCFLDRDEQGRVRQIFFVPQSFERAVTRGDHLGVEIVGRLHDQLFARSIVQLDECRAVELILDRPGRRVAGALLLDQRSGAFRLVRARVVVLATGGACNMYRFSDATLEKSGDGQALAYRAGCAFVNMEMIQVMPMGLLMGASRLHSLLLEEGLRYAGGKLMNGLGERFMQRYDPERMEASTLPAVTQAIYQEMRAGRATRNGGVLLDVSHLDRAGLWHEYGDLLRQCAQRGADLTAGPVEIAPLVHFQLGGVKIDPTCQTDLPGLLAAGEDTGGVHGAGRLAGNTSAESTTFGRIAGDRAAELCRELDLAEPDPERVEAAAAETLAPLRRASGEDPFALRSALQGLMWEHVGVVRRGDEMRAGLARLSDLEERARSVAAPRGREWNLAWQAALDVRNLLQVARLTAEAALHREESRGAHVRSDFPSSDERWRVSIHQRRENGADRLWEAPVAFTRLSPAGAPVAA